MNQFARTEMLIGSEKMERLQQAKVAVFGIGGVGGYVVEALARSGVGEFLLVDNDKVSESNINRQIIATHSSIGRYKTEVMRERILDINPNAKITVKNTFFLPENAAEFELSKYDYIVDAIDTVTAKLELIMRAKETNTRIICSMGTGNKLDPSKFQITDIYKTSVCPLAKVMRKECRVRGVEHLKVLFSTEEAIKPFESVEQPNEGKRSIPGSISFVPSVAGLMIAGEVIRDLIGEVLV